MKYRYASNVKGRTIIWHHTDNGKRTHCGRPIPTSWRIVKELFWTDEDTRECENCLGHRR